MSVGVGLLGCGVVGSAVVRGLAGLPEPAALRAVAVRGVGKDRDCVLPAGVLTEDPWAALTDPAVEVVVEVIGAPGAVDLIAAALELGKPVVTANKAALGAFGPELRAQAAALGVPLLFEAAVAGAVPVVRGLASLGRAEQITRIEAVLNGTATFVLSHMEETGAGLDAALAEARRRGLAEADASRDLDGTDAADKLALLAQCLFGACLRTGDVRRRGLQDVDLRPVPKHRWRLVATAERGGDAWVEPVLLPADHPFARLRGADNSVTVHGARCGPVTLSGAGAGGDATACSVLADLLEARDWVLERALDQRPERPQVQEKGLTC